MITKMEICSFVYKCIYIADDSDVSPAAVTSIDVKDPIGLERGTRVRHWRGRGREMPADAATIPRETKEQANKTYDHYRPLS